MQLNKETKPTWYLRCKLGPIGKNDNGLFNSMSTP